MTVGGSIYSYDNDKDSACLTTGTATPCALAVNGNSPNETFNRTKLRSDRFLATCRFHCDLRSVRQQPRRQHRSEPLAGRDCVESKLYGFNVDYNPSRRAAYVVGASTDSDCQTVTVRFSARQQVESELRAGQELHPKKILYG